MLSRPLRGSRGFGMQCECLDSVFLFLLCFVFVLFFSSLSFFHEHDQVFGGPFECARRLEPLICSQP